MELGLHYWSYSTPAAPADTASTLAASVRLAEQVGFRQFTVMDHWFQMEATAPAEEPMLEAYSALAYVAALTERMRLGTLVTGVTYRHPGLLVKTATTLDVLSDGRGMLGIGAAWYEREHLGLGVPYPPIAERFERLEETLRIALQMWGDEVGPFQGEHYTLAETLNSPRSVSRPHPPIMIGGGGEKKTLRLAAQYAQIVNLTTAVPEEVAHKLDVLREHCARLGTDYDAIEKTVITRAVDPVTDPDAFLAHLEELASLGITLAVLPGRGGRTPEFVETVGELMPRVAAI
ncbi:LLM class F420-dependent oxidoreductase [Galbitalea sp. SE-J8]|uniref:LLM class F420-dependent oxidoreductase n=1 Tax=Galbitalea sp. SE-J8 TaxID=3054952 RepID=UPI00259CF528|nr:LLM class F420-dependent oxidoreductase [Galbitalea sp. SE-J8]MDM4764281.1 LLM class F420-dependent oxidoreductase [Galbitalea sp. SE-J8]